MGSGRYCPNASMNSLTRAILSARIKAVNNRDRNFTHAKMARRIAQIEESVGRYLRQLDSADRQEPSEAISIKTTRIKEKIARLKQEMSRLEVLDAQMRNTPDQQISLTDPDARSMATSGRGSGVVGYNVQVAVDTEHHLIVTHEVITARPMHPIINRSSLNWQTDMTKASKPVAAKKGRVLLVRRPRDKLWIFPGGRRQGWESERKCLHREIREELPKLKLSAVTLWKRSRPRTGKPADG